MKSEIILCFQKALSKARQEGKISNIDVPIFVDYPDKRYGDYATNVAFLLSKKEKKNPREIASIIAGHLEIPDMEKLEIAGPGFINITMKKEYWYKVLKHILDEKSDFGNIDSGRGRRIHLEFVSANPTGPLHIGHGRGAAVGDSLSRILKKAGFYVEKEYYINDAGRQIKLLGESLWARIMEILGKKVEFPEDGYHGKYVMELAKEALKEHPEITKQEKDKAISFLSEWGKNKIMEWIKEDLSAFEVQFDTFFSEKGLHENGKINEAIELLKKNGYTYEKEGALWFKSTEFGDEKDRVLIRANGEPTYFAADVAYHMEKFKKGFDLYINIWGADHHGYIKRVKAALQALGYDSKKLEILLIQMVSLLKDGKPISMSKRAGELITLRWLIEEVGKDAARFIFLTRKCDAHLEFDIEVAKRQTEENPVFYVQYAHARICSIFKNAQKLTELKDEPLILDLLKEEEEIEIIKKLSQFPDIIESCARNLEPHRLTYYLQELASLFHTYYNRFRVLVEDVKLAKARLAICKATQIVIAEGLNLLGVSAPEVM